MGGNELINNMWKAIFVKIIIFVLLFSHSSTVFAKLSIITDLSEVEPVIQEDETFSSTEESVKTKCEGERNTCLSEGKALKDNSSENRIVIKLNENIDFKIDSLTPNISIKSYKYNSELGFVTIDLSEGVDVQHVLGVLKNNPLVEYAGPSYRAKTIGSYDDNSDFESVSDSVYTSVYTSEDPYNINGQQWGITVTEMVYAWKMVNTEKIKDIVIAVIDTGVDYNHPDLAESIVKKNGRVLGYDYVNVDNDPFDDNGHGTHVAGIAAAVKDNGEGIAGVASGAKIMPVKVLDVNGLGWSDHIADGIIYAVQNGADIINLSVGVTADEPYLHESIRYARSQGIVVIAACGGGSQTFSYPSEYPEVIAVGATDQNNELCEFSGLNPDLVAPGNRIISTYPIEIDVQDGIQDGYTFYNGTSMSAPFASGLAAIILSSAKEVQYGKYLKDMTGEMRASKIEYYLQKGTSDLGEEGFDKYYGSGIINAKKLVENPLYKTNIGICSTSIPYNIPVDITAYNYRGEYNGSLNTPVTLKVLDYRKNLVNETVAEVVYGQAYVDLKVTDVGKYGVIVLDEDDKRSRKVCEEFVYIRPEAPYSSMESGTYTGSQKITLLSKTEGAFIYYTLDGSEPSLLDSALLVTPAGKFESVIQVDKNTTVKALSYKNGAVSGISTYNYVIVPEVIHPVEPEEKEDEIKQETKKGGNSGGGGRDIELPFIESPAAPVENSSVEYLGSHFVKTIVTLSDNKKKMVIKTSSDYSGISIDDAEFVEIDAKSEEKISEYEIHLSKEFINLLGSSNKLLKLRAEGIVLSIDKINIVQGNNKGMEVYIKRVPFEQVYSGKMILDAKSLSDVYSFKMFSEGIEVLDFYEAVNADIGFDEKTASKKNRVGVFCFSDNSMKWEYSVGRMNKDNIINFNVNASSAYVVIEYDKTFKDIKNHWAKDKIEMLASRQIVMGMDDNSFLPDCNVNRAQFVTMLVSALGIREENKNIPFTDIENAWYTTAIKNAYAAGIVLGTDEKHFSPDNNITREQMATILIQSFEYFMGRNAEELKLKEPKEYTDEKEISEWARKKILEAYMMDLLTGYEDGSFKPQSYTTRAEAAVSISRLMDILGLL